METYVLRVWLPDRPGALGAVASRIGAVKGDVVGIEILETGSGQAVDELVVQLPDATLMDLLVNEVRQVDGVQLEEIRWLGAEGHDPRRAMLETAARFVAATTRDERRGSGNEKRATSSLRVGTSMRSILSSCLMRLCTWRALVAL